MKQLIKSLSYALFVLLPIFVFCDVKAQIDTSLTCGGVLDSASVAIINEYSIGELSFYDETIKIHTIHFSGDSTEFWLDMSGDSLVWGGDMKLTKSAEKFIKFCDDYVYSKIDSLESELNAIRKKHCR